MMWAKRRFLLLTMFSIVSMTMVMNGCTTFRYLDPINVKQSQQQIYVDGYPAISETALIEEDQGYIVKIFGYTTSEVLALQLFYGNGTDRAVNVLPDQIRVYGIGDSYEEQLKVWEANEYIRRVRRQQNTVLVLQAISGSLEAASAGYSTTQSSGTYSGSYYGSSYGSYSGTYAGSSTTYDQSKVAEANARNAAMIASQAEAYKDNLQYLDAILLKRTTLEPGYYMAGSVYVERVLFDRYRIEIPIGDKTLVMRFRLVKDR